METETRLEETGITKLADPVKKTSTVESEYEEDSIADTKTRVSERIAETEILLEEPRKFPVSTVQTESNWLRVGSKGKAKATPVEIKPSDSKSQTQDKKRVKGKALHAQHPASGSHAGTLHLLHTSSGSSTASRSKRMRWTITRKKEMDAPLLDTRPNTRAMTTTAPADNTGQDINPKAHKKS